MKRYVVLFGALFLSGAVVAENHGIEKTNYSVFSHFTIALFYPDNPNNTHINGSDFKPFPFVFTIITMLVCYTFLH